MALNEDLAALVEEWLRDGYIEGLAVTLRLQFPALAEEVTGALGAAIEKLIVRPEAPDDAKAWFATVAFNELKKEARRRARHESLDAMAEDPDRPFELADSGWTVEQQALRDEVYKIVRSHVEAWETGNVRQVTLLYLEAAYLGEPVTSQEISEIVTDITGEFVDDAEVRTWKHRGYKRLREWVEATEDDDDEEETP